MIKSYLYIGMMKIISILFILLFVFPSKLSAAINPDLNGDGAVDIRDLRQLIPGFSNIFDYNSLLASFGVYQPVTQSTVYYVSPTGSTGNSGTQSSPWSLGKANQSAPAGSTVILLPGTYTENISPPSGTAGNPTIFKASSLYQAVINNKEASLQGKSYIIISGIKFQSSGPRWVTAGSANHITFENCYFHQSWPGGYKAGDFNGFSYAGTYLTIRGSRFGWWHAGDMLGLQSASNVLIEDNDFSQAASGHIEFGTSRGNFVIRRNLFHNPWDRIAAVESAATGDDNYLFEDNIIFDSNWDGSPLPPDASSDPNAPGANQVVKFNTGKGIFRNNLLVGNNKGLDSGTTGMFYVALDSPNPIFENSRIYHNTIHSNPRSGISLHDKINSSRDANNVFKNNVISGQGGFDFLVNDSSLAINTYLVSSNILANTGGGSTKVISISGATKTVAEAQAQMPGVFKNNLAASPVFVNPGAITQGKADIANWPTIVGYGDFALTAASPGKGQAEALTYVTSPVNNSSNLTLADALYFSDGFGVVEGDEIIVGSTRTRVVRRVDNFNLQVSPAVTAAVNDRVYLGKFGPGSDIGIKP